MVPSHDCEKYWCDYLPKNNYSSAESSTFVPNGTAMLSIRGQSQFRGPLSYDTVRVGDLSITHQPFMEYNYTRLEIPYLMNVDWGFDGVLGLAPNWNNGSTDGQEFYYPNYLSLLTQKNALDNNVMSLRLPHRIEDKGELMLGGDNIDLYVGDFRNVQLTQDEGHKMPELDEFYSLPSR